MVTEEELDEENGRLMRYLGDSNDLSRMSKKDVSYLIRDTFNEARTPAQEVFFKQLEDNIILLYDKDDTIKDRQKRLNSFADGRHKLLMKREYKDDSQYNI